MMILLIKLLIKIFLKFTCGFSDSEMPEDVTVSNTFLVKYPELDNGIVDPN